MTLLHVPPPEWAPQRCLYTAFPSDPQLWLEDLEPARAEVMAMVAALAPAVPVRLLCATAEAAEAARDALRAVPGAGTVTPVACRFGDIWLRDTAPIFLPGGKAAGFRFNGWGGKYVLEGDAGVGAAVAADCGAELERHDFVLEGGAIDGDGTGLCITTEQCLLNPNRNPGMDRAAIEHALGAALGVRRLVWLGDGLVNDHTDGHVDNLARFVGEATVAIPVPAGTDDPNAAVFDDARRRAASAGLAIADMPSPGRVERDGAVVPASYMNFVIANGRVAVPLYGAANDDAAVAALARLFPEYRVSGLRADHILTGGGSFHCITQQVPEA
jgi:agmatine deiminase